MSDSSKGFSVEFDRVQKLVYRNSVQHGFHDLDGLVENNADKLKALGISPYAMRDLLACRRLMLSVSELSEAMEVLREGDASDDHCPKFSKFEIELADEVIRCMDLAESKSARLGEAIVAKMVYNKTRPIHHGNKKF